MSEPLAPGTMLDGRYRIVRLVAEGGMSLVYEVEDQRLPGRLVAKQMREIAADEAARRLVEEQFRREAETLSRLSHPNLIRVSDWFTWEGKRFLIEELVEGRTLEELAVLERNEPAVLAWAEQICDALAYLHDHGIVYRDLKPSNVMVTGQGGIRLIDFGIVRSYTLEKSRDTVVMGTPGYAAPEQYGLNQTDPRSDIFSLGALLHHLLTGHDPVDKPFVFPLARSLNPSLSERTERVLRKAVALEPERRFQSALEMKRALRGAAPLPAEGERFAIEGEPLPPGPLLGAGGAWCLAAVGALAGFESFPTAATFTLCFAPLWLGLLARGFWVGRHESGLVVQVEPEALTIFRQGKTQRVRWESIREVRFESRGLGSQPEVVVATPFENVRLPLGRPRVLPELLVSRGLAGGERLGRLIVEQTGLSLSESETGVYR